MSSREAVKKTIQFILSNLVEEQKFELSQSAVDILADELHDDVLFLEKLQDFTEEFLNDFGENYGL